METKSRYLLVGLLALAAIAGGFLFVYWLNTAGGLGQRTSYEIRFDAPVPGLLKGSAVLFNGLRVGELVDMRLDPSRPHEVMATIAVEAQTPVRSDTTVSLNFQGLTGVASISLEGGVPGAPPLAAPPDRPPLLVASVAASQDTMQAARQALQRFDQILADNSAPLKNAIANFSTFSDTLARNSDRIDKIAAGLEQTFGGEGEEPSPANYSLTAPSAFPPIAALPQGQLVVAQPTTLILFDTQRILVRSGGATTPEFEDARWSDTIPMLVQATIVRALENAGYRGVSPPIEGVTANNQLLIDIRDFTITPGPQAAADVEFGAKILDENGEIAGARTFQGAAQVSAGDAASAAAALDEAFRQATTELVTWTLGVI